MLELITDFIITIFAWIGGIWVVGVILAYIIFKVDSEDPTYERNRKSGDNTPS